MGICSTRPEDQCVRLLAEYKLGAVLGQGSFGIVYSCKDKSTGREYAVKMIDKAESPYEDIVREVEMLQRLSHQNVVSLHDTFYEKVFVCLVMDIYRGGDLITGMQVHWRDKGDIPNEIVARISEQMLLSIAWLHSQNVVHRDVKGDNYMLDYADIRIPACGVYLSDFGTVCDCSPKTRLRTCTGTTRYWSPEFYEKNYGQKVDVWAIGVVTYGLVNRTFPFKDEVGVKKKEPVFKVTAPDICKRFVKGVLRKAEKDRLSAEEALQHKWLEISKKTLAEESTESGSTDSGDDEVHEGLQPEEGAPAYIAENGPNRAVARRRQELVERLEDLDTQLAPISTKPFEVSAPQTGRTAHFEWWSAARAQQAGILNFAGAEVAPNSYEGHVPKVIARTLAEQGVDVRNFGQGKARSLPEFVAEVRTGNSRLMQDASNYRRLVRVVDLVLLRLSYGDGRPRYLVKTKETLLDGRERPELYVLPGMKALPHENVPTTSQRILEERLGMRGVSVDFNFKAAEYFEEEVYSANYPGVRTVYRKTIVPCKFSNLTKPQVESFGLAAKSQRNRIWRNRDSNGYERTYEWMTDDLCKSQGVRLARPTVAADVSALVNAPVPLPEEELTKYLRENNVVASKFPNYEEFVSELQTGEAAFEQNPDGRLIRVVELVVLVINNPKTGELLVEAGETVNGKNKTLKRLPATKRRADENHFLAARRVLSRVLRVDESSVTLRPTCVKMIQEIRRSHNYLGLPAAYNKRIVYADVSLL